MLIHPASEALCSLAGPLGGYRPCTSRGGTPNNPQKEIAILLLGVIGVIGHWSCWFCGTLDREKKTVKLKERTIPKTWCTWCLFPVWGVTIFTKELQYLADLAVGSVSTGKYEYQRWIQGNSMMQCLGNVLGPFGLGVARTLKVPLHPPMLLTCWVLKMHSVCFL